MVKLLLLAMLIIAVIDACDMRANARGGGIADVEGVYLQGLQILQLGVLVVLPDVKVWRDGTS